VTHDSFIGPDQDTLPNSCAPYYPRLAGAALRYTLRNPQVSTVIPGTLAAGEIDMNVVYTDGPPHPHKAKDQLPAHGWPRDSQQ
jgi:hypothetical protein